MKIDVLWTPAEMALVRDQDRTTVVIDVLRAATTIATAIHNGAKAVVPASSIEEAVRIANQIGRENSLLCGERQGVRIQGFDLGNSPAEFSRDAVEGRTLVMTTSNGTSAMTSLVGNRAIYVGALVNMRAAAEMLARDGISPLIVCAGRNGRVAVEDALCAGLIVESWLALGDPKSEDYALGDGARAALALARQHSPVDARFLADTEAGRALKEIGQAGDLELCARLGIYSDVPVLRDRQITRYGPGDGGDGRAVES